MFLYGKPAISENPGCNMLILAPEGMGLLQALKAVILVSMAVSMAEKMYQKFN